MNNPDNITWIVGESTCRWKGMHADEWMDKIGTGSELYIDKEDIVVLEEVIYCSDMNVFLNFIKGLDCPGDYLDAVERIKPMEQLKFDIDINLLREFQSDLEAYYKRHQEQSRAKVGL